MDPSLDFQSSNSTIIVRQVVQSKVQLLMSDDYFRMFKATPCVRLSVGVCVCCPPYIRNVSKQMDGYITFHK